MAKFDFAALGQIPMLCGGTYWAKREPTEWDKKRNKAPAGLAQFKKGEPDDDA